MNIRTKISEILYLMRNTLWVVPALFFVFSMMIFFLLDKDIANTAILSLAQELHFEGFIGSSASALVSHANSLIITIFALSVSLTMIVLTLASNQLGPRIIELFMGSRQTQFVLGFYIASIVFLLLTNAKIGDGTDPFNIPVLAVIIGCLAALVSPVLMIFFVSHLGNAIIADNVVRSLSQSLDSSISLFMKSNTKNDLLKESLERRKNSVEIHISDSGYLHNVDTAKLVSLVEEHDGFLDFYYNPGAYLLKGQTVAVLYYDKLENSDIKQNLIQSLEINDSTPAIEDIEYFLRKLVEVALRALSSGINDPYTAISCLNYMFSSLQKVAISKDMPSGVIYDDEGKPRIKTYVLSLQNMYNLATEQIIESSSTMRTVQFHILDLIVSALTSDLNDQAKAALKENGERIIKEMRSSKDIFAHRAKISLFEKRLESLSS